MVFGLRLGLPTRKSSLSDPPPDTEPPPSGPKGAPKGGPKAGKGALTVNEFVAKTKRSREKGLEPTKPELISYAKYLGIDPVIDGDLMWIADEALKAPLPCEWTEHHDSSERIFYYNVDTHESSWTHPLEQLHRDTYKSIVHFRSGSLAKEDQLEEVENLRRKCEQSEREAHKELQSWTEHKDEQGQKFFFHKANHRSVWTDPRPARCHALYLQMKALRELGKHCGQAINTPRSTFRLNPSGGNWLSKADLGGEAKAGSKSPSSRAPGKPPTPPGHSGGESDLRKNGKRDGGKAKNRGKSVGPDDHAGADIMRKSGGLFDFKKSLLLDLEKPSFSAPEDARGGLGVSNSLPLLSGGSPLGEGLSTNGRAKVRAGIRLEPIRAGT